MTTQRHWKHRVFLAAGLAATLAIAPSRAAFASDRPAGGAASDVADIAAGAVGSAAGGVIVAAGGLLIVAGVALMVVSWPLAKVLEQTTDRDRYAISAIKDAPTFPGLVIYAWGLDVAAHAKRRMFAGWESLTASGNNADRENSTRPSPAGYEAVAATGAGIPR